LTCLLFTLIGHHIIFHIQQLGIKAEMKKMVRSTLSREEEQVFSFSVNDKTIAKPEWENENEFRLDGKMYDVIEKKIENGEMVIRCVSDDKETDLIKRYEKINSDAGNSSKSKTALLIKLISTPYVTLLNSELPVNNNQPSQKPSLVLHIISKDRSDVLTPPPQA
jgi:hypothetical protein